MVTLFFLWSLQYLLSSSLALVTLDLTLFVFPLHAFLWLIIYLFKGRSCEFRRRSRFCKIILIFFFLWPLQYWARSRYFIHSGWLVVIINGKIPFSDICNAFFYFENCIHLKVIASIVKNFLLLSSQFRIETELKLLHLGSERNLVCYSFLLYLHMHYPCTIHEEYPQILVEGAGLEMVKSLSIITWFKQ